MTLRVFYKCLSCGKFASLKEHDCKSHNKEVSQAQRYIKGCFEIFKVYVQ